MALTAATISGTDAIALGLADFFMDSDTLPALAKAFGSMDVRQAVQPFCAGLLPPLALISERGWIDECYAFDDVEAIVDALQRSSAPAGRDAAGRILAKSTTALKVTGESLRQARRMPLLEEALDQEYRVSLRCLAGSDFPEGIRAQVIDKDQLV